MGDGGTKISLFALAALTGLVLVGGAQTMRAQTVKMGDTEYIPRVWRTEEGLPQNSVTSLVQTRDGYLWVGTFGGLARFDGVRFTIFNSGNTPELKSNRIIKLHEASDDALWIISEHGHLTRYAGGRFTDYTGKDGLPTGYLMIRSVFLDREGRLWVGTFHKGLFQFQGGRLIRIYTTQDGLPTNFIDTITQDEAGNLWFGSEEGLAEFHDGRFTTYTAKDGLPGTYVMAVVKSRGGGLWVGTERDVARYKDGAFTTLNTYVNRKVHWRTHMYEDRDGALWIANAGAGLQYWKDGRLARFTTKEGLENDTIMAVIRDREDNLWFGPGGSGLVRWREKKLTTYAPKDGLYRDDVKAITEDTKGAVWIGNDQIIRFQDGKFLNYPGSLFVEALYADKDGSLWFGNGKDLGWHKDGRFTTYPLGVYRSHAIYRDQGGRLWVGTNEGLSQLVDGKFLHYRTSDGLIPGPIVFITQDRQGALWLGSTEGMSRFKDGQFTNYTTAQGLSHHFVRAIHEDADGTLWIGTYGGGLNRFRDGRFIHYTTQNGLFDDIVSRILEDDRGNFWMSGNRGIFRVSRKELNDYAEGKIRSITSVSYGVADGMLTSETNGGSQPAGWRTRDGKLWFPTIKGVVVLDPNQINTQPPPVTIEQVLVGKTPVAGRAKLEIPPDQGDLEIHYTALSFVAPEKVQFKYRLEGYDADWIAAGTRRAAYYTNLPPGRYTFRVIACNNDGVWNETGAALPFYRVPSFYQTWSFYALSAAALLLLGWGVNRARVQRLERRLAQEQLITERLRQVDQLKDEFLANTSHELRTPLHGMIGLAESLIDGAAGRLPAATAQNLSLIVSGGKRLAHLVNDILDFSKLKHRDLALDKQPIDLRTLTDVVLALARPLLGAKPLELKNNIGTDLPPVEADENRLQQVMHNLVGNAIKFTESGAVTVSARAAEGMVEVTVADTGVGIPADKLEDIFKSFEQVDASLTRPHGGTGLGLAVTKQLIELHGGRIWAESEMGRGSRFIFTLPMATGPLPVGSSQSSVISRPSAIDGPVTPDEWQRATDHELLTTGNERPTTDTTILVVDDEPINRQVLTNHLRIEGYRILTAQNGPEALERLAGPGPPPDLILLDVMMPGMSGYEVCQKVRARFPAHELPVILVTAKNQVADLLEGLSAGANDYLGKPFTKSELIGRVRTHLALARATREVREARDRLEVKVQERTADLRIANGQLSHANERLKEANQQLGQANENMLAVFNQWHSGVMTTDETGCVTFLSHTAERLFGQSPREAVGRPWDQMVPLPESDKAQLKTMSERRPTERGKWSCRLQGSAGQQYWTEIEVQDDPRDPRRKIFFLYDVSEVYDLRRLLDEKAKFHDLVGESLAMQLVYRQIRDLARVETTVLIQGETGTGKELVARAIHYTSPRKSKPFVAINCAGLTESLLTSQLFGHRRGAFTGAVTDQMGLFESAQGGTLFLDEIGDMPPSVQTSLLRVLQEKEITRLGETKPRPINVRVIAATHRDLEQEVAAGRFRQDLFYRIQGMPIQLLPLRERREDVPLLVAWFLGQFRAATERPVQDVSPEAMQALLSYHWPGNVRELKSALESAAVRCPGRVIQAADLPAPIAGSAVAEPPAVDPLEKRRQRVLDALARAGGNRAAAARLLGVSRSTLYLWLEEMKTQ